MSMLPIRDQLTQLLETRQNEVDEWFRAQYNNHVQPVPYSSVDLRHSGNKLAPVDTNLFPAGFNNLNEPAFNRAVTAMQTYLQRYYPLVKTILLVTENHTRNGMYLDNIATLLGILSKAGYQTVLGNLDEQVQEVLTLESANGTRLDYQPLTRKDGRLQTLSGVIPDLILNNNDLSTGIPPLLTDIAQPIIPDVRHGWYRRRKSSHFLHYDQVARRFGETFAIDPFFISTVFYRCGMVHFKERTGIECVALGVEKVMTQLREKYAQYGIEEVPYVFVKADNGTYGMGIMTVRSGDEVIDMNKKLRNKMDVIKGGVENTEVIIQEGIRTIDRIQEEVAEPMLYLVGGEPVSCIFRVHGERDDVGNLNAQGMRFEKNICEESQANKPCAVNLIARLASLAASLET